MLALVVLPRARVVEVRDVAQAIAIVRAVKPSLADASVRELANQLVRGTALVVEAPSGAPHWRDDGARLAEAQWFGARSLRVLPRSCIVSVRDEAHAMSLLRSSRPDLREGELQEIAWAAASGYALLVVADEFEPIDAWSPADEDAEDLVPDERTPEERDTRDELTWLSFEVVDDRGKRLDGGYVCTIDGRVDDGPLEREKHGYDELQFTARAQLDLRMLDLFAADALGPVDPVDDGIDPDASEAEDGVTTFEVVDENGRPWLGEFALARDDVEQTSGSLRGRITVDPGLSAPLTLTLHALHGAALGGG